MVRFLGCNVQGHQGKSVAPVEVDVFAAATGADEMPLRQAEFMAALGTATGQGRCLQQQLRSLGRGAFRKEFKAGLKSLRFHTGDEPKLAFHLAYALHPVFRVRRIVIVQSFQTYVQKPLNQTRLMHALHPLPLQP